MTKSYLPKSADIKREWHEIDASKHVLGRLASRAASILRGKNKAIFTPHLDTGDFVVVVNAEKVKITGRKPEQKEYFRVSGYPGGLKKQKLKELFAKKPQAVIERAVRSMLPANRLRKQMMKRLKIVVGEKHNFITSHKL